jgi:hypothetical protein
MKKLLKITIITGILTFIGIACNHKGKEEVSLQNPTKDAGSSTSNDKITKEVYTDEFGDRLEVIINETKNTAVVRLEGKSYELTKSEELPEYTAADAFYQYSDIRGDITFINKDYNMVMFHHKKEKQSAGTKMASF